MELSHPIELSKVLKDILSSITHPTTPVPFEIFDLILCAVFDSLTQTPLVLKEPNEALKNLEENKSVGQLGSERVLQLYTSFSTLIVKASSENLSSSQLETILEGLKWTPEQISKFLQMYVSNQVKIRAILKLFGKTPPRLVDVKWRLDYQIETNIRGPVHELIYFIDLILDDNGVREPLSFSASHAQLEDLVNILKDACQSVKRVALM